MDVDVAPRSSGSLTAQVAPMGRPVRLCEPAPSKLTSHGITGDLGAADLAVDADDERAGGEPSGGAVDGLGDDQAGGREVIGHRSRPWAQARPGWCQG